MENCQDIIFEIRLKNRIMIVNKELTFNKKRKQRKEFITFIREQRIVKA